MLAVGPTTGVDPFISLGTSSNPEYLIFWQLLGLINGLRKVYFVYILL